MTRFDFSSFLAFFAARFSFKLLPGFLLLPDGGALVPIPGPYAGGEAEDRHIRAAAGSKEREAASCQRREGRPPTGQPRRALPVRSLQLFARTGRCDEGT